MAETAVQKPLTELWDMPNSHYAWFATVNHKELSGLIPEVFFPVFCSYPSSSSRSIPCRSSTNCSPATRELFTPCAFHCYTHSALPSVARPSHSWQFWSLPAPTCGCVVSGGSVIAFRTVLRIAGIVVPALVGAAEPSASV